MAGRPLVEITEGACARSSRVAARATRGCRRRCPTFRGKACRGHGEYTQLRIQLFALTLGTRGLVAAEDKGFEFVLAFLADVFKNRHGRPLPRNWLLPLESICGNFANLLRKRGGDAWDLHVQKLSPKMSSQ